VAEIPPHDPRYVYESGPVRVLGVDCTFGAEWTTLVEVVPVEGDTVGLRILHAEPGLTWVAEKVREVTYTSRRVAVTSIRCARVT